VNPRTHAIRIGISRGWTEFRLGLRSPQDLSFYLVMSIAVLGYLFKNRNDRVEGTDLLLPAVMLPSVLGGLIGFGGIIGVAYALSIEREDGTLLRTKSMPYGMTGYLTGHVVRNSLEALPTLIVVLVPGLLLFDGVFNRGFTGVLTALWVAALGLLIAIPLGSILGSVVKGPQKLGTWGLVPVGGMLAVSGIFYPFAALPGFLQTIGQLLPAYWLGLGMRSAFLPESAAAAEIGGSWRTWETVGMLSLWAVVALLLAPVVLRRMARRESGSRVEERRDKAIQRVS
jgi:ABC-2 type transport system permease protein